MSITTPEVLLRKAYDAQHRADLVRQAVMGHEKLSRGKINVHRVGEPSTGE